jgi:putative hydrolase of the HAD superfamily
VVFDLGGVVTDSPLEAIVRYERAHGLEPQAIARAIAAAGDGGAWPRLERGELTVEAFYAPFEADCRAAGIAVSADRLMAGIAAAAVPRPRMLEAIGRLRRHGFRVGALTNNWVAEDGPRPHPLRELFHGFVESSAVGLRKPDPRIYALICRELGVEASATAFLDDLGQNLKTARALGMHTIKVTDPNQALRELGALVGIDLTM